MKQNITVLQANVPGNIEFSLHDKGVFMNFRLFMVGIVAFAGMTMAAQDGIVKIGDEVFDENALVSIMKSNNLLEPFTAIEVLKQKAMAKQLARKRKLDMADPEKSLYMAVTGKDLGKDLALKNTRDVPLSLKKPALLREEMFTHWLTVLSEQEIPVSIINNDKLWDIFKQTDSYKIRAEHNQVLKPEDGTYTWADLSVDPKKELASQKGKALINGEEFNAYCKMNKNTLNLLGKRRKEIKAVRGEIVRMMAAGKLLSQEHRKNKVRYSDLEIERAVSRMLRNKTIDEDFSLKNFNGETLSDYMEMLNSRSRKKNGMKANTLRAVLRDSVSVKSSGNAYDVTMAVMHASRAHSEMKILNELRDDDVYEWMKAQKFKGSVKEGRMVLAQERQNKHIDDLIKSEKVIFNVE